LREIFSQSSFLRRAGRPDLFPALERTVQILVVESGVVRVDSFPLAQPFEGQLQILTLLFEDIVKRLLLAPAGQGAGQPIAERVGPAAGAFDFDPVGGDGAQQPFGQRGLGGFGGSLLNDSENKLGMAKPGIFISKMPKRATPRSASMSLSRCVSDTGAAAGGAGVSAGISFMAQRFRLRRERRPKGIVSSLRNRSGAISRVKKNQLSGVRRPEPSTILPTQSTTA